MRGMRAIAGAFAFLIWLSASDAQPNKVIYELQERCGRRAAEMFEKDFPPPKDASVIANYENHYSPRLNKCFLLERTTQYYRDDQGKSASLKILVLVDVNENRLVGSFDPLQCDVQGKACKSEEEWMELIRPFMEN